MCRAVTETGRRCPCDTSEARRLRRHNSEARKAFENEIQSPLTVEALPDLEAYTQGFKEPDYSVGGEKIQEVHDSAAQLAIIQQALFPSFSDEPARYQKLNLPTGEIVEIMEHGVSIQDADGNLIVAGNRNLLVPYAEKMTVHIGGQIHEIVEARSGIKDSEVLEDELAASAEAQAEYDKAKENAESFWEKTYAAYGGDRNSFSRAYSSRDDEEREKALALYEEGRRLDQEKWNAKAVLDKIASQSSKDAAVKLEKQREVLIETLKEIRNLGGDVVVADNSAKKVLSAFREATSVYPTAWIEASNENKPPRIKATSSRAHYTNGNWQRSYKIVPEARMTLKPEGWEPDPNEERELGVWVKMTKGQYGDWEWSPDYNPDVTHSHYPREGNVGWVHHPVQVAKNYRHDYIQEKPKGRGWVEGEIDEKVYVSGEGFVKTGNKQKIWYRPVNTRQAIETVLQPELTISGNTPESQKRVALHEFAHRIESSGRKGTYIKTMEEAFLARRTTDPETGEREKLQTIYKGTKERGRPDNFTDFYMGKEYADGSREVLSTGAEAVFSGEFGGLIGLGRKKADPEMKKFIIGLWASA